MKHKIVNSGIFPLLVTVTFSLMAIVVVFLLTVVYSKTSEHTYTIFIKNQLCIYCIPMIVLGILAALFGVIFLKVMNSEVIDNWMIIVWFSFCIVFAIYVIITISVHYMDIKNDDYITYTGEFKKDHTREFVFLNDENSTRLKNRNETFLETGNYSGKIVYSKRSKYVLSYSLNNGKKASVTDD